MPNRANKLDDAYQEMFNLRFQRSTGQLTNTACGRVRRQVARIKTILRGSWQLQNKERGDACATEMCW